MKAENRIISLGLYEVAVAAEREYSAIHDRLMARGRRQCALSAHTGGGMVLSLPSDLGALRDGLGRLARERIGEIAEGIVVDVATPEFDGSGYLDECGRHWPARILWAYLMARVTKDGRA